MNQPHFSLTYEGHRKYMCEGLSNLQQNGEFVDMTIAADGHYVKVHKIVMSLASSSFKEIISSAPGQHPMIYLNNVSFSTLSAILEYIYMGETHIAVEKLNEFTKVAKDLHINGLDNIMTQDLRTRLPLQSKCAKSDMHNFSQFTTEDLCMDTTMDHSATEHSFQDDNDGFNSTLENVPITAPTVENKIDNAAKLQYTLSNKNSLMVIFNRYMYRLNYIYKRSGQRYQWKCIHERAMKCPALVISENDKIIKRSFVHNHPFDDKRILKKMQNKSVFSTISDAENKAKQPITEEIEDSE